MMDNIKVVVHKLNLNMTTDLYKDEDGSFSYAEKDSNTRTNGFVIIRSLVSKVGG